MTLPHGDELCVLVMSPLGRDAELTCIALREGGIRCRACRSFEELFAGIRAGCGAVMMAEEALRQHPIEAVEGVLREQSAWSDLPIILLTLGGGTSIESAVTGRAMERLGNVLLLERPTRVGTMLSLVRTALRARQRQYEIRRHVAELEAAEQSLARRSEELARSNAELQDFAYIASHDLKEPLRGISSYVQFLMEDEGERLSAGGVERLRTLSRLSRRMYTLLDCLLEYSRAGRTELALSAQDVRAIVDEVVETMRPWLEEQQGRVEVRGPLPVLLCDRVRTGQVFTNLIANAIKYNDRGPRLVEVGCEVGEGKPVLYVRDNGIGIPQRFHETVFKMFRRLHQREEYGGGTGAGLALVKRIVERHGGRIWLESEPGQGSTFYFTLTGAEPAHRRPLRRAECNSEAAAAEQAAAPA
jgi:signal transduction histidine kinase